MSLQEIARPALAKSYPEEYLVEQDEEVSAKHAHTQLIRYLVLLLEWLYHKENWFIASEIIHKHPAIRNSRNKIVPDIAVFKGIEVPVEERTDMGTWYIKPPLRPCPPLVFEVCSARTWPTDIGSDPRHKPAIYGRIGVKEYFAYDPYDEPVWDDEQVGEIRLLGWRYEQNLPVPIQPDAQGRLWSEQLESWLVADGAFLRLYDQDGNLRLTETETVRLAQQQEITLRTEADQRNAELERQIAELQRQLAQRKSDG